VYTTFEDKFISTGEIMADANINVKVNAIGAKELTKEASTTAAE